MALRSTCWALTVALVASWVTLPAAAGAHGALEGGSHRYCAQHERLEHVTATARGDAMVSRGTADAWRRGPSLATAAHEVCLLAGAALIHAAAGARWPMACVVAAPRSVGPSRAGQSGCTTRAVLACAPKTSPPARPI